MLMTRTHYVQGQTRWQRPWGRSKESIQQGHSQFCARSVLVMPCAWKTGENAADGFFQQPLFGKYGGDIKFSV